MAAALRLDKQHANELLLTAGLPTIDELRGSAQDGDGQLLEPWGTDSLSEPLVSPDWDALRDTAARITEQQMGALLDKYDPKLYVQRDDVYQTLQSFLTSDKGCFVLTGRSGAGKSSFVLSLISAISSHNTLCLLAYDGARMPYQAGLSTVIGRDMDKLGERTSDSGSNVFERLESEQMMEGKILLLIIDAINENGQSRKLLKEIDYLVGDAKYPWLKVLITCRPYAWRLLCRGMRLAEHRYYRPVDGKIAHLGPDRLTIELPPFSLEELQVAYDHYCQVYGLTTPYESLAPPVREMLRDPLVLRLITQTNQGPTLSAYLRPSQIIKRFLHAMIASGRLLEQDLLLLELGVMPLMFDDGIYRNTENSGKLF
ncbi:MAG: hypothetical protein GY759_23050 [Chloroflexi bacterium]|nr:hypothetical protein [Chloroflexota bacterium]